MSTRARRTQAKYKNALPTEEMSLEEKQLPAPFNQTAAPASEHPLPLRLLDCFQLFTREDDDKIPRAESLENLVAGGVHDRALQASGLVLEHRLAAISLAEARAAAYARVCIHAVNDWVLDYSDPPAIWLLTKVAWYRLVTPAPGYSACFQCVVQKLKLARNFALSLQADRHGGYESALESAKRFAASPVGAAQRVLRTWEDDCSSSAHAEWEAANSAEVDPNEELSCRAFDERCVTANSAFLARQLTAFLGRHAVGNNLIQGLSKRANVDVSGVELAGRPLLNFARAAKSADPTLRPAQHSSFLAPPSLRPGTLMVWDFCHSFRELLRLPPFPLWRLELAFAEEPAVQTGDERADSRGVKGQTPLLIDLHLSMLRVLEGLDTSLMEVPTMAGYGSAAELAPKEVYRPLLGLTWPELVRTALLEHCKNYPGSPVVAAVKELKEKDYDKLSSAHRLLLLEALTHAVSDTETFREYLQDSAPETVSDRLPRGTPLGIDDSGTRYFQLGAVSGVGRLYIEVRQEGLAEEESGSWGWYNSSDIPKLLDWLESGSRQEQELAEDIFAEFQPYLLPQQQIDAQDDSHQSPASSPPDGYSAAKPEQDLAADVIRREILDLFSAVRFWEKDINWLQARAAVILELENAQEGWEFARLLWLVEDMAYRDLLKGSGWGRRRARFRDMAEKCQTIHQAAVAVCEVAVHSRGPSDLGFLSTEEFKEALKTARTQPNFIPTTGNCAVVLKSGYLAHLQRARPPKDALAAPLPLNWDFVEHVTVREMKFCRGDWQRPPWQGRFADGAAPPHAGAADLIAACLLVERQPGGTASSAPSPNSGEIDWEGFTFQNGFRQARSAGQGFPNRPSSAMSNLSADQQRPPSGSPAPVAVSGRASPVAVLQPPQPDATLPLTNPPATATASVPLLPSDSKVASEPPGLPVSDSAATGEAEQVDTPNVRLPEGAAQTQQRKSNEVAGGAAAAEAKTETKKLASEVGKTGEVSSRELLLPNPSAGLPALMWSHLQHSVLPSTAQYQPSPLESLARSKVAHNNKRTSVASRKNSPAEVASGLRRSTRVRTEVSLADYEAGDDLEGTTRSISTRSRRGDAGDLYRLNMQSPVVVPGLVPGPVPLFVQQLPSAAEGPPEEEAALDESSCVRFWKKEREVAALMFYVRTNGAASIDYLVQPQLFSTAVNQKWNQGMVVKMPAYTSLARAMTLPTVHWYTGTLTTSFLLQGENPRAAFPGSGARAGSEAGRGAPQQPQPGSSSAPAQLPPSESRPWAALPPRHAPGPSLPLRPESSAELAASQEKKAQATILPSATRTPIDHLKPNAQHLRPQEPEIQNPAAQPAGGSGSFPSPETNSTAPVQQAPISDPRASETQGHNNSTATQGPALSQPTISCSVPSKLPKPGTTADNPSNANSVAVGATYHSILAPPWPNPAGISQAAAGLVARPPVLFSQSGSPRPGFCGLPLPVRAGGAGAPPATVRAVTSKLSWPGFNISELMAQQGRGNFPTAPTAIGGSIAAPLGGGPGGPRDPWKALLVRWDAGTIAGWPARVSPWEVVEDAGGAARSENHRLFQAQVARQQAEAAARNPGNAPVMPSKQNPVRFWQATPSVNATPTPITQPPQQVNGQISKPAQSPSSIAPPPASLASSQPTAQGGGTVPIPGVFVPRPLSASQPQSPHPWHIANQATAMPPSSNPPVQLHWPQAPVGVHPTAVQNSVAGSQGQMLGHYAPTSAAQDAQYQASREATAAKKRKFSPSEETRPAAKNTNEGYRERWVAKKPRPNPNTWLSGFCSACEQQSGDQGLIPCMGPCLRSFHSSCLGANQTPTLGTFFCPECDSGRMRCFICGDFSNGFNDPAMRKCSLGVCGRFYHIRCATEAPLAQVARKGGHFRCPQHYCLKCGKSGDGMDMVKCIRCPTAYHSICMSSTTARRLHPHSKVVLCEKHGEGDPPHGYTCPPNLQPSTAATPPSSSASSAQLPQKALVQPQGVAPLTAPPLQQTQQPIDPQSTNAPPASSDPGIEGANGGRAAVIS